MPNRVEELESEVSELHATVDALLSELTDTKTRVARLEAELADTRDYDEAKPETAPAVEPEETQHKLDSDTGQIKDEPVSHANNQSGSDTDKDSSDDDDGDSDVIIA